MNVHNVVDATCRDGGQDMRWDAAVPRLSAAWWAALLKPVEHSKPEPEDDGQEVLL